MTESSGKKLLNPPLQEAQIPRILRKFWETPIGIRGTYTEYDKIDADSQQELLFGVFNCSFLQGVSEVNMLQSR